MPKSKKVHWKRKTRKLHKKYKKNMRGGVFTAQEEARLNAENFTPEQIDILNQLNIPMGTIDQAIDYFNDNLNKIIIFIAQELNTNPNVNLFAYPEIVQENNDNDEQPGPGLDLADLQGDVDPQQNMDMDMDMDNQDNELDQTGNTSMADESDDDEMEGGRKRHTRRKKGNRKSHKRNKKGGALYGRGYGANCSDPNYSIYNTNLLKLFPYSSK